MTQKLLAEYELDIHKLEELVKNQKLGPYRCIKSAESRGGVVEKSGRLSIVRRNTIAGLHGNTTYFLVFGSDFPEILGGQQVIDQLGSWKYKLPGEYGADTVKPERDKHRIVLIVKPKKSITSAA